MHVSRIKISNFMGIEELELKAGKFNVVSGHNGAGKTSILEALKIAFGSGHDATVLRNGQSQAETMLELDDDTTSLRTRIKPLATDRAYMVNGKAQASPVSKISALVEAISINPVEFLTASKEKRMQVLLESMPLVADCARLERITGVKVAQTNRHALEVIAMVRKQVYDDRTATNGAIKSNASHITQLQASIPVAMQEVAENETELLEQRTALIVAKEQEQDVFARKIDGIRAKVNAEIDDLQAQIKALEAKVSERKAFISEQESKARAAIDNVRACKNQEIAAIDSRLAAINAVRDSIKTVVLTKKMIETQSEELLDLEKTAEKQTKALEKVDEYKRDLLSTLPIIGLEFVDGKAVYNGVDFDRVNTAQKVQIAVEVAKLRAGPLKMMCVDGLELLDESTFEAFKKASLESGVQMFVTRVSSDDLTFEAQDDSI